MTRCLRGTDFRSGRLMRWDGTSLTDLMPTAGEGGPLGLSCPTVTWCTMQLSWNGGHSWVHWDGTAAGALPSPPPADGSLSLLTCAAPTMCMMAAAMVDNPQAPPATVRWDGTSWTTAQLTGVERGIPISDLSCPTPTFCATLVKDNVIVPSRSIATVLRAEALLSTWDGRTWSPLSPVGPPPGKTNLLLDSVSAVKCGTPRVVRRARHHVDAPDADQARVPAADDRVDGFGLARSQRGARRGPGQ